MFAPGLWSAASRVMSCPDRLNPAPRCRANSGVQACSGGGKLSLALSAHVAGGKHGSLNPHAVLRLGAKARRAPFELVGDQTRPTTAVTPPMPEQSPRSLATLVASGTRAKEIIQAVTIVAAHIDELGPHRDMDDPFGRSRSSGSFIALSAPIAGGNLPFQPSFGLRCWIRPRLHSIQYLCVPSVQSLV